MYTGLIYIPIHTVFSAEVFLAARKQGSITCPSSNQSLSAVSPPHTYPAGSFYSVMGLSCCSSWFVLYQAPRLMAVVTWSWHSSHILSPLTLMLLAANLANIFFAQKSWKMTETMALMDTHLRVLSESYLMNTNFGQ